MKLHKKYSRWGSLLASTLLIVQLAISPIVVHAQTSSDEEVKNTTSEEYIVFSVTESNNAVDEDDELHELEEEEEKPPDKNAEDLNNESVESNNGDDPNDESEKIEEGEDDSKHHKEELIIPSDFNEHKALIDKMFKEFQLNRDMEILYIYAESLAKLPLNGEYISLSDKQQYIEKNNAVLHKLLSVEKILAFETYFGNEMLQYAKEKNRSSEAIHALNVISGLPSSPDNNTLKTEIRKLVDSLKVQSTIPGGTGKYDEYDFVSSDKIPSNQINRPPNLPTISDKPIKSPDFNSEYTNSESRYYNLNGVCMKEVRYYNKGKLAKKESVQVNNSERYHCYENISATEFTAKDRVKGSIFTGYNPYDPQQRVAMYKKNQESKKSGENDNVNLLLNGTTIQYTFNKNDDSPYYYDTGIAIGNEEKVTYEQAKHALHFISIHSKGKYVEDVGQVLALVGGQIVRIHEYEGSVSFEEFEKNFELTNVGVRALNTRSKTQQEVADLVEVKKTSIIHLNGIPIPLENELIVDNNITLFPAKQLISLLGGTSTQNENELMVIMNGVELRFTENKNTVLKNRESVKLEASPRYSNSRIFMIPIEHLLSASNAELNVLNQELHLQNK